MYILFELNVVYHFTITEILMLEYLLIPNVHQKDVGTAGTVATIVSGKVQLVMLTKQPKVDNCITAPRDVTTCTLQILMMQQLLMPV